MKKIRLPLLSLLLLCFAAPSQAFELTVLHTNDVHSMYGGTTEKGTACYAAQCAGGSGGSVRLKQAVDTVRAAEPNVVLLDAGDEFQGTLFYTQFKGDVAAEVLDALDYTAFTPGNHEFDDGCGEFRRFVERTHVPVLAVNLTLPPVPGGKPLTRPWIVVERQGRKIGIVGLVNEETPSLASPCKEAVFGPAETALREAVVSLRAQGVNIVIALTHLGLNVDCELAGRVDGVDVFVGGHTHSLLSNTNPKAVGPYPIVKHSPSGEPVLVVTAASSCKLLGHIAIDFNDAGIAQRWNGEPIVLDGRNVTVPPDAKLSARGWTATPPSCGRSSGSLWAKSCLPGTRAGGRLTLRKTPISAACRNVRPATSSWTPCSGEHGIPARPRRLVRGRHCALPSAYRRGHDG